MLKVISQRYEWNCGDGCCSESKHTITFLIKDSNDGHWSSFYVEDVYVDAPETFKDLIVHYSEDTFEGKLIRMSAMCGQFEFELTDDEFVGY